MLKIPTTVRYDKDDAEKFEWGASLKASDDIIIGVKLLLDPSQNLSWHVARTDVKAALRLLPPSKTPKDVAADFLRAMVLHAVSQIRKRVTQAVFELLRPEYILSGTNNTLAALKLMLMKRSVPAVWSDAAKDSTLEVQCYSCPWQHDTASQKHALRVTY